MWPTVDGLRVLKNEEADLASRAIGEAVARLEVEASDETTRLSYGIDWFDQWEWQQRLWLIEQIVEAFFTPSPPPPPAAILEATVDAIFREALWQIESEIDCPTVDSPGDDSFGIDSCWRHAAIQAFACQNGKQPTIDADETDLDRWHLLLTQVVDGLLGPTSYQKAELLRDGSIDHANRFLERRGLPPDFLSRMPPLPRPQQTKRSLERIRSLI